MNDLGTLTGTFWPRTGSYPYHGFLTDGSTFTQIDYPAANSTSLAQVNNNGWFVGNYSTAESAVNTRAFYAIPSTSTNISPAQ